MFSFFLNFAFVRVEKRGGFFRSYWIFFILFIRRNRKAKIRFVLFHQVKVSFDRGFQPALSILLFRVVSLGTSLIRQIKLDVDLDREQFSRDRLSSCMEISKFEVRPNEMFFHSSLLKRPQVDKSQLVVFKYSYFHSDLRMKPEITNILRVVNIWLKNIF